MALKQKLLKPNENCRFFNTLPYLETYQTGSNCWWECFGPVITLLGIRFVVSLKALEITPILIWHQLHPKCLWKIRKPLIYYLPEILDENVPARNSCTPPWSNGSVLEHRSLPPRFESGRGHIWRMFHLWLRLITFGGRSTHLAYLVHKSGRKQQSS